MPQGNVVRTHGAFKDPKTKGDFIDRMMSREFSGDLKDLAVNHDMRYERIRPNALKIHFGTSGQEYELVIRKPRGPRPIVVKPGRGTRAKSANTVQGKTPTAPKTGEQPGETPASRNPTRRRMAQGNSPSTH